MIIYSQPYIYSRSNIIDGFHMKPMLACVEASHAWVSYIYSMHILRH